MPEVSGITPIAVQPSVSGPDGPAHPKGQGRRRGGPRKPAAPPQDRSDQASAPAGTAGPHNKAEGASRPRKPRAAPKHKGGQPGGPSSQQPDGSQAPAGPSGEQGGQNKGRRDGPVAQGTSQGDGSRHRPRNRPARKPAPGGQQSDGSTPAQPNAEGGPHAPGTDDSSAQGKRPRRPRGRKFQGELTEDAPGENAGQNVPSSAKYRSNALKKDDLTSRLIHDLSTPPYPDCLICFAPITPMQPTWSCSPSNPTLAATDDESGVPESAQRADANAQCCWMTFHLKCIRSWASKSVKDMEEAWRVRGEPKQGDWRCPGCQSKRRAVPSSYWCFCGSTPDPKPPRLATPHSCANPCARPRACGHPCAISCHPGPCPPCQVTTQMPCYCGKDILSFRCAHLGLGKSGVPTSAELSCGQTCARMLNCGNHRCQDVCHPGRCKPCPVRESVKCYCGKEEREMGCGEGEARECRVVQDGHEEKWVGRFACENICNRLFDCGIHSCSKPCHPPSPTPVTCPRSPSVVTHCPCGKHSLTPESTPFFPPGTQITRTACTDPIPTCESTCMKPLEGCEHVCSARCHAGPCPPCSIVIVRPCRCGSSTRELRCFEDQARARARARGETGPDVEILCERPCGALKACGRHQCRRQCCPLASLAGLTKGQTKGKGKKRAGDDALNLSVVDQHGWHECDLVCGKLLSCGNHHCEERDHRGPCPPCLRSSFEEMVCHCGRTVLEPPIPCGTRITCGYPCNRPSPPCGHPLTRHACHEDPIPCPPCPFLTTKKCACGKKMVDNVRCSQEYVSCGQKCGKLLGCGFHHCERFCHGDACGPCHAPCGKPRKLCMPAIHPCTLPCHAPASCDESEPCRSIVTITCPCGRIRQPVSCGRSSTNPAGREGSQQLKCTNECAIAKRNARLAEALGINPDKADSKLNQVTYHDDLVAFARANPKFCSIVEKSFSDFLASEKKSQILPHMPEQKRKFVHDLAAVYRIDTQMVDQEPHRSVQLLRRIDSRIPTPLLSSVIAPPSASSSLGKLADLRAPLASRPGSSRASAAPSPTPLAGGSAKGWTAVVARQPQPAAASGSWGPSLTPAAAVSRAHTPARSTPSPGPPRVAAPAPVAPAPVAVNPEDVPEDWEQDV
ncbi:hypothetical protein FKP32DRAFT_707113 [Trametes sanguinea]|nr:hypothetical protein FKP32DRAFT_707113 [Trametes sanguinea]